MCRGRCFTGAALALTALAGTAHAQELSPRESYERGAAEYDKKDYAKAAVDFARADELSPNDTTLTYALEAAMRGHLAPLGMELALRVDKRVTPGSKLALRAQEARKTFAHEVGQLTVTCPAPITFCKATVDKQLVTVGAATYVAVGAHAVHISADGAESDQTVPVAAEASVEVAPPAQTAPVTPAPPPPVAPTVEPPPPPPPPPATHAESSKKLSPTWFWIAGGATVLLAGASIASGVDTSDKHDAYAEDRTNNHKKNAGQSAQLRTNILWGATALVGIGAGTLGLFFVGWSAGPTVTASAKF